MHIRGYEILDELGRGGMGVVYRAKQTQLERIVALKMIGRVFATETDRLRFRTEAVAFARLEHENIVRVYDFGECNSGPFFAMEYAEGGSLKDRLTKLQSSVDEATRLVKLIALAVHHAHERNVIHRDLKPANVLLKTDGTPKLTDFGLAKCLDRNFDLTRPGDVFGTLNYMSPEQATGRTRDATPAMDIYSLGAMFYELLTGRPPFVGADAAHMLDQIRNRKPLPPIEVDMSVPPALSDVCLKCLRKSPSDRFRSAYDLASEMEIFETGSPLPPLQSHPRQEERRIPRSEWWRQ